MMSERWEGRRALWRIRKGWVKKCSFSLFRSKSCQECFAEAVARDGAEGAHMAADMSACSHSYLLPYYQGQIIYPLINFKGIVSPDTQLCTLQRDNTENLKQIFPGKELLGCSPNSYIHVSVSDLYIPLIGLPILLQENRWAKRIYSRSLTDTWMWKLELGMFISNILHEH